MMDPSIVERVLHMALVIQLVPAPTFEEQERAELVQNAFIELGVDKVFSDDYGNIYSLVKGREEKRPLIVTAHLDTVFPRDTNLKLGCTPETITGPGIGDNSLGLAGLFGLLWALNDSGNARDNKPHLAGDLWLVADVGEEGLGNLQGMKSVTDRFGDLVQAYIVLEGLSLGQIYHRGLSVRRYQISVHTKGGHSWVDYGAPSAIHELADLVVKIKAITLPLRCRSSLNIGTITGGTSVNTIASEASLLLDLRSESFQALEMIACEVERLVKEADKKGGTAIEVEAQVIGTRPAGEIPANHPLVKLAEECHIKHGLKAQLNIGSTDANVPLSRGLPAICIGLTTGGGAHTVNEYIDVKPIEQGLGVLFDLTQRLDQQS